MSIRPRGDGFQVDVGRGAGRIRKQFDTRADAQAFERNFKAQRHQAHEQAAAAGVVAAPIGTLSTLTDVLNRAKAIRWAGMTDAMPRLATRVVDEIGPALPPRALTQGLIHSLVTRWVNEEKSSGGTINRRLAAISVLCKVAHESGALVVLPRLPRQRESTGRIRWYDEQEEADMVAACRHLGLLDLADYIVVAIDTGFRSGELHPFKVRDYSSGMLHLWETKSRKPRAIPATPRVTAILAARCAGKAKGDRVWGGWSKTQLRRHWDILRNHMEMQDDPQFLIHTLRHTCASRLVQRGVPLAVVQAWMGHDVIATTMRYAHLAPKSLDLARIALAGPQGGVAELVDAAASKAAGAILPGSIPGAPTTHHVGVPA